MDMLFFIGQALAIAAIGYAVSHAFAYAPIHGDPVTSKSTDLRTPAVRASADAQMENPPLRLSFVPESVGGYEDFAPSNIHAEMQPPVRDADHVA
jgi:hypothetical protein